MMKQLLIAIIIAVCLSSCSDNSSEPDIHSGLTNRIEIYDLKWDSVVKQPIIIVADTFSRNILFAYKRAVIKEHLNVGDKIFISGLRENGDTISTENIYIYSNDERHYYDAQFGIWANKDTCYRFSGYYIKSGKLTYFPDRKVYFLNR